MTPLCWEKWESWFREQGHQTLAPAWPEHDAPIEQQRQASAALGALTLVEVVEHFRKIVGALDEKPILIGHSMGGLIVQLLLSEGLAAAGIAIDSAPPKGVISLKWSFLRSNWPAINPLANAAKPISLSFAQFQYAFVNGLPPEVQRAAYDRYVVPESRRVGKGPTTSAAIIDYKKPRPPLLMIAGGADHIIPASLNRDNFARYKQTPGVTDFREFPGRTHWTIAQDGWQDVAAAALEWLRPIVADAAKAII